MNLLTNEVIKRTTSRCPACLDAVPAEVARRDGRIVMSKRCPAHGLFEIELDRSAEHYHTSFGDRAGDETCCGGACGCSTDPFDTLSTCIALIEIVDSCNLACPTCYAGSPRQHEVAYQPFDAIVRRVQAVLDRKRSIDILQLSGGEPTLHPEFARVLRWATEHERIGYVLVNTNGVRLATDNALLDDMARLRRARLESGRAAFELYLQFDGPQESGQTELRGVDLRLMRERVLDRCEERDIPVTLAMVVTPETIGSLGDTVRLALARPICRGVSFQPMFTSGRVPVESSTLPLADARTKATIGVGSVIDAVVSQAPDLLTPSDFTPLPCGDPNCHTIGYLIRTPAGPVALGSIADLPSLQGFLADRVDYRLEDLAACGCEHSDLGRLLEQLEVGADAPLRIFIKPFMDAWTFDQDRIDRCCTHVIREDGSLDSFCRHYLTLSNPCGSGP